MKSMMSKMTPKNHFLEKRFQFLWASKAEKLDSFLRENLKPYEDGAIFIMGQAKPLPATASRRMIWVYSVLSTSTQKQIHWPFVSMKVYDSQRGVLTGCIDIIFSLLSTHIHLVDSITFCIQQFSSHGFTMKIHWKLARSQRDLSMFFL